MFVDSPQLEVRVKKKRENSGKPEWTDLNELFHAFFNVLWFSQNLEREAFSGQMHTDATQGHVQTLWVPGILACWAPSYIKKLN